MICPICEGQKVVKETIDDITTLETCLTCDGTGSISQEKYQAMLDLFDALETIEKNYANTDGSL